MESSNLDGVSGYARHTVTGSQHPLVADHCPTTERAAGPLPHHRNLGEQLIGEDERKLLENEKGQN